MTLLLSGLALFIAIHVLPTFGGTRAALVARLGEKPWKLLHTMVSLAAIVLVVLGWKRAPTDLVYVPPAWGRVAVFVLMLPVLYLLIGRRIGSNLKRHTAHPMLWGFTLWAAAHLLAHGEVRALVLFGGFALYALVAMWSQEVRGVAQVTKEPAPIAAELRTGAAVLVAYALIVYLHGLAGLPLY
jgi:uncharacterized membrane protein